MFLLFQCVYLYLMGLVERDLTRKHGVRYLKKYITKVDDAKIIELNCPHYVQDYEYATIAEEIKLYLSGK